MVKHKKLLITGCGRSGTKYITFLLRRLGMDVSHERVGEDGVASWYMAVDATQSPFGDVRGKYQFEHIFHQVRHPLAVIASVRTFKDRSWQFIFEHIPIKVADPLLLRCAKYWYYWNLEVEKIAHWRYRIEDLPSMYAVFCERLQITADQCVLDKLSKEVNTRKHGRAYHIYEELCERLHLQMSPTALKWLTVSAKPTYQKAISWEALRAIDLDWKGRVMAKANEYGYFD